MADNSAYFEFGTNIDQVVSQVESGLKAIIESVDSVGAKAGKGGAGGSLNANSFLSGINQSFSEMTQGSLQALKNITDQFKKAAASGNTSVNGQNLTQAVKGLLADVNVFADDLVKGLQTSLPKSVGTSDLSKVVDQGFTQFRTALTEAIQREFNSIKQIGSGAGLKLSAFGQPTSGANQAVAATDIIPSFTQEQQAMDEARLAVIAFADSIKNATALTVEQRSLLRQSARGQGGKGRFAPFAFQGENGESGFVDPRTGEATTLGKATQGSKLTQLTDDQAKAIEVGTQQAQRWSTSVQGAATATQQATTATQKVVTAAEQTAAAWAAARDQALKLAAGIRQGTAKQIGTSRYYTQDGKVYQTQTRNTDTGTQSGATEVNDPLQLQQLRQQLLQRSVAKIKSAPAAPEEKTSYDEFLQGFFGAGGRKRTGGSSPIDTTNPLAGFAETAGIVSKYELQGRAIQSLSGQVHDAVTSYFALDEAIRQYNNVAGDGNAATASYVSSLENLSNAAGIGVVEALQSATRGVAAFSDASTTAAQKNTIGQQFASQTAKYSVVTGQSSADSTSQLIAGGQAFGLDTTATSLGRITNAIANAKESFGSDSSAVGQALSELGAQGKQAGFSLEEFAQVLGKIQSGTGDSGGTLVSNVGRLLDQFTSGTNKQALSGVGVNVTGTVKDEILSLAEVYPKLNNAQQTFITAQLGGARAMKELVPLLGDTKSLQDAFNKAITDGNAGDKEYAASVGSLAGSAKKLSQEFKSLGVDIARTGILTPLLLLAKVLETIVQLTDGAVQAFDNLASPFHIAGQGANQLVTGILAVVAAYAVLRSARNRLGGLEEGATSTGRGVTGIIANRVGHRRITSGRDLRTGERLSESDAEAQRADHGVKTKNPLVTANQESANQIRTATEQRVETEQTVVTAERELIAILDQRIAAETALITSTTAETVAKDADTVATDANATAQTRGAIPFNLNARQQAEAEAHNAARATPLPAGAGGDLQSPLSRGARLRNFLRPGTTGGGLSSFTGGTGGLLTSAFIAAAGYSAITSTQKGTDTQLAAEAAAKNAGQATGVSSNADTLRDAASKLSGAAAESAKASSGIRGVATQFAESLFGGGGAAANKSTRADDKQQADRLNALADRIDKLNASGNTSDYLTSLVSFKSLDQLNTSIQNLQNTGASGTDVFLALDKALGQTVNEAAGVTTKLTGVQTKILATTAGTAAANAVTQIHDQVTADNGGLNPAGLGGVGLGGKNLENFVRHNLASGTNDKIQSNVTDVIQQYLQENPNFNPQKDKGTDLVTDLKQSIATLPEFQNLKGDQKKAAQAFINSVALSAYSNLKQNAVFGINAVAPADIGKQIDQALATSQAYAQEAQTAFSLGSTSYQATNGKQFKVGSTTVGGTTVQDSPELAAAQLKLAGDKDLLEKAKKYKGANSQGRLDAAQKTVDQDTLAVTTAAAAQYQQAAQIASQNLNIEDKVGQEQAQLAGIQATLNDKTLKMSQNQRQQLEAQAKALGQQSATDTLAAANAVADAGVQTGNTLAFAQQQASDAASVFEQLDAREQGVAKHSQDWANAKKDAQDKYLAAIQAGVDATNQQSLAKIDPRNVVAVEQQTLANLKNTLAVTTDPGQRAQLQQQINAAQVTINEDTTAQANAALEAGNFPGDPLGAASTKLQEASNNLKKDLFLTTQWLTDYAAFKQAVIDNATAIANANLTANELTQDLTDPVQQAKNQVTTAKNKLQIDTFFKAPKAVTDADKVALQQAASAEEQAAFTQRLGFVQTDYQLYRITLPQYIQKLKDLRAAIKGNSIQAINDRNQIDQDLLSAYQSGSGQFNIGSITLPTLYEARRQGLLAGQVTTKGLADAGQKAINDGTNFNNIFQPLVDQLGQIQTRGAVLELTNLQAAINAIGLGPASGSSASSTTNHITINGTDFAQVVAYLAQALGVSATSTRTPTSTRKV